MVHIYELQPTTSQKSFYGKARVYQYDDHTVLYSYSTPVLATDPETGELCRTWSGWSATTGKHIRSFCGINKAEYFKLPYRSDLI